MAQCNFCGKRYWFFSHHQCPVKPRQTSSSASRSYDTSRTNVSDSNDLLLQQQLLQQTISLTSSNDDTCRSIPIETSYSHHNDSSTSSSSNHCHSSNDSSSSYSSDSSSSSYDSGSSSSSSWD